jgi:methylmalonyl-CoA/ethylmalonyl-CoA epimerase
MAYYVDARLAVSIPTSGWSIVVGAQVLNSQRHVPAIDHLGWAVRSIDAARHHFEAGLGLGFQSEERFPEVRTAFFGDGPTRIELLEPLTPETELGSFIASRGEGLHHLALRVDDVATALAEAQKLGFKLVDRAPRPGSRGTTVGVVDPQREDGVLVQYVQGP